jgi:hypothetical protein
VLILQIRDLVKEWLARVAYIGLARIKALRLAQQPATCMPATHTPCVLQRAKLLERKVVEEEA